MSTLFLQHNIRMVYVSMLYLSTILFFFALDAVLICLLRFYKKFSPVPLVLATVLFGCLAIPIDIFFTWYGVWTFGTERALGIWFFGLPLEEYLFYISVPPFVVLLSQYIQMLCAQKHLAKKSLQ
ncbi:hypothetical protein COU76_04365 [Candidatus Peregrinibacteria bacterium CG10_big_fil_rev_8_21_14_0_10_49_10]|nr:MAG: hypothetical protein COU76_04365 [Candidatus Peregrinibacteria bacterium CG10_big_fil_rev_8_21_14_0_10_49_10]